MIAPKAVVASAGGTLALTSSLASGSAAQLAQAVLCAAALAACAWLMLVRGGRARSGPRSPRRARLARGQIKHAGPGAPPQGPPVVPTEQLPLVCDTVAALLESGMSLEEALAAAGSEEGPAPGLAAVGARLTWGSPWEQAWASAPGTSQLAAPLWLSFRTGAPAAALLNDAASEARRRAAREHEAQAAAMTVRLVLPLGLCALPAFVCLGIVPVALALLPWL